jgi:probable O-glycosylation ligase (exosortase A-associated)
MRDLVLAIIVVGATIGALRRPVFGIIAYTAFSFFSPQSSAWGFARSLPASMMVGVATIAGYVLSGEPKRFPRERELFLLLALWLTFAVTTIFAIYPAVAYKVLVRVSKVLLVPFLCTALLNDRNRIQWILRVIGLSIGFYGFKGGIFAIATGGNYMVWGPEESCLASNNSIGMALAMNIPVLIYLFKTESNKWLRMLVRAMALLSYPAVVCTFSRGAWIATGVVTALSVMKSRYRFLIVSFVAIVALVVLPALPTFLPARVAARFQTLDNVKEDNSAKQRFGTWELCKRVGLANPMTGGGFDYYSKQTFARYMPEFLSRWPGKIWSCHSMWLTIFGEHGFPGIVLWLALLSCCFLSLRHLRRVGLKRDGGAWIADCAAMIQCSLVAYMCAGTFLDIAYFEMFYYLIAVLIALKATVGRMERETGTPGPQKRGPDARHDRPPGAVTVQPDGREPGVRPATSSRALPAGPGLAGAAWLRRPTCTS